jgi:hypothetical protein
MPRADARGLMAMTGSNENSPHLRRHHIMIAIIAVVVAVALVLNYYLW